MNSLEVARLAGVSRSTVSRVINGYTNVSDEKKRKIMEVVEQYGYSPNSAARSLVGTKNKIIGLFILNYHGQNHNIIHSSPFFTSFLTYAADYLQNIGYKLIISIFSKESQIHEIESMLSSMQITGGIIMGDILPETFLEQLSTRNYNVILVNQYDKLQYKNILLINTVNYQAAYQVTEILVRKGHESILHIAGPQEKASTRGRFEGYRDCMKKNELPCKDQVVFIENIHDEEEGYRETKKYFLSLKENLPSAIFACNDLIAFGAMRALRELGFKIPRDISIVGYDDTEISRYMSPSLSTVSLNIDKLAKRTVSLLVERIEGKSETAESPYVLEEFEVLVRESISEVVK